MRKIGWAGRLGKLLKLLLVGIVLCAGFKASAAEDSKVGGDIPAVYTETISHLLTPLETILKKESEYIHEEYQGLVLLDETIYYVDAQGKRYGVYHTIYKALNAAGVRSLSEDTNTFRKQTQRLYVVLAQTIQPDGTKTQVQKDGIITKTPQNEAEDSIYNDEEEAVVIYPNVKIGSVVEQIVLIEDIEPRIKGQFTQVYAWAGTWPQYYQRLVIDLPKSFADRLKTTEVGDLHLTATTSSPSADRRQFSWEKYNVAGTHSEETPPPSRQVGPALWLSTIESWDAYASWYEGMSKGSDELSPELKSKIDGWTKDVKDPEQILRILNGHVAFDVRYTGIEFGMSSLRPHTCVSVWDRQYGDCKDKANLLRAMLTYKGIPSWLTFVDTVHAGLVCKGSPDYRQFDHCILTAQPGKSYVYCDPTITFGVPGLLSGSVSDRDVLLIKEGKAEWAHTPVFQDSSLSYLFDLKLQPSGELAGWVTLECTGYYAVSFPKMFQDQTKDQIISNVQDRVRQAFPNAEVADVEPFKNKLDAPMIGTPQPFVVRAYMVLRGVLNQGETTSLLKFPGLTFLLPDIDQYKKRKYATFIWPDLTKIAVKIQLPPGWGAETLPAPFQYASKTSELQAKWSQEKDAVSADFRATIKQSLFPPADMVTLGNAIINLQSWSGRPLSLTSKGSTSTPQAQSTDVELAQALPVMPTGEGQINLIDSEFPEDGNVAARRAALERIASQFPSDKKSIASAGALLANLDLIDKKWDEALTRLRTVLETNRSALDLDTSSWLEYLMARALEGQKKVDEAQAIYQRLAEDKKCNNYRRSWSYYHLGMLLQDKNPTKALDYLDAGLGLENADVVSAVYTIYPVVAMSSGQSARLKERLDALIAAKPENLEDTLIEVAKSSKRLIHSGKKTEGIQLLNLLEALGHPEVTGSAFAQELKKMRTAAESGEVYAKLQTDLKQALANFSEIAALEKKQPAFSSIADAKKSMTQHENAGEDAEALGCWLRIATGYPADDTFPENFWQCINYGEWTMRMNPTPQKEQFFNKLVEMSSGLPHTTDAYVDIKLLYAKTLERNGHRQQAAMVYKALMENPDLADGFRGVIFERNGINWEELGDYTKALESDKLAEPLLGSDTPARRAVLRASFIQFDDENKSEAFRLLQLLAQGCQKSKIKTSEQLQAILPLAEGVSEPPAYWEQWHSWWPQWLELEKSAGVTPSASHKIIPIILSKNDLASDLAAARKEKDPKKTVAVLRNLVYATRYYPNSALDLASAMSTLTEVMPDHGNDARLLMIAILKPITFSSPEQQRSRLLALLINYVDSNQADKALDLMAGEGQDTFSDDSATTLAIRRVWAVAAAFKKQNLDQARSALEKDLKNTTGYDHRMAIGVLADVYHALGKNTEEASLLESEISNPDVTSDTATAQRLKTRLDNLRNASIDSKKLADGVNAWLKESKPAWWDYAEPKSIEDPRISRLEEILKNFNGEFTTPEYIKACLMAPSSSALTYGTQYDAVLKAFTLLLENCQTVPDVDKITHSFVQNEAFPELLRRQCLYSVLFRLENNQKIEAFEVYRKLPLAQGFTDKQKNLLARTDEFIRVDRTSESALTSCVLKASQHPMDSLDLGLVEDSVSYLLVSGHIEAAESIYHASATYTLGDNAGMTRPEFQLRLLRMINSSKNYAPLFNAFHKTVLDLYKPDTIKKPAGYDQRLNFESFGDLSEEEAKQFRLYLIKNHQEPLSILFWQAFSEDYRNDAEGVALKLALLKVGFQNSTDDDVRAILVRWGMYGMDIDDATQRESFLSLIKTNQDASKYPHMSEQIRVLNAQVALRDGKTDDIETNLSGMQIAANQYSAICFKIRSYRQSKDWKNLKNLLGTLSADVMMQPYMLHCTLPALESVGMKDEAELARETLNQRMYQDILECWFNPAENTLQSVTTDIVALDSIKDVPDSFSSFLQSRVARQRILRDYQLEVAFIAKDWSKVAVIAQEQVNDYPTFYTYYWMLGRSKAELGKKEEAIQALTVYSRYAKDEESYPEAKELLAKLGAPQQ